MGDGNPGEVMWSVAVVGAVVGARRGTRFVRVRASAPAWRSWIVAVRLQREKRRVVAGSCANITICVLSARRAPFSLSPFY